MLCYSNGTDKDGRKRIDTESLCLLKTEDDTDINNKYAPAMFVKILTKYGTKPVKIETPFLRKAKHRMIEIDFHDMIRKKCIVIGAIRIDNIFIGSSIASIQTKLTELLVVEEIKNVFCFQ